MAISDLNMAVTIDPKNEDYREAFETIKNSTASASPAKIFLFTMLIGTVIGGLLGFLLDGGTGLALGVFLGLGIGRFISAAKIEVTCQLDVFLSDFGKALSEGGIINIIKGSLFSFFMTVVVLLIRLIWEFIKSPFITIYRLITRTFYLGG